MNIVCAKEPLLKAVRIAESLLLTKNINKADVLIDASSDTTRVLSTDLETSVMIELAASIEKNGSVVVFGKRLSDIISNLPNEDVQLTVSADNLLKIKSLSKGIKALFSLKGLAKSDFPVLPKISNDGVFKMEQKTLKTCIRKVILSASNDDMRYVLNGILFNVKRSKIRLVATDGRRLSVISAAVEGPAQEKNVIVSKKVLAEIEKMLGTEGECQVGIAENQVFFQFDNITVISRLIEGDFPDFQQVVPASHDLEVVFNKEELLTATKRVSLMVNENFKKLTITLDEQKAVFDSQDPEIGDAFEEVKIVARNKSLKENFVISFNCFFLMDVLKVVDTADIVFHFNKNVNPAVILEKDGDDYLSVIMPMKNV
jgi:DNA polymerase-3 subunit beta